MSHQFGLAHQRLPVQPLPANGKLSIVPHHEIGRTKTRQVVKEVRALTQLHIYVRKRGFYNRSRSRDLAPVYWNAQRGMRTSPSPEADHNVGSMLVAQPSIDGLEIFGNLRRSHRRKVFRANEDDVANIGLRAVAHHPLGSHDRARIE